MAERENWMSPLNRVLFMQAFRKKATKVTIRDGREFTIRYDVRPLHYKVTDETRPLACVEVIGPEEVPFGFFDLTVVTNAQWVSDGNKLSKQETTVVK